MIIRVYNQSLMTVSESKIFGTVLRALTLFCSYSVSPLDEEDDQEGDLSDLDIGDNDLEDNDLDEVRLSYSVCPLDEEND